MSDDEESFHSAEEDLEEQETTKNTKKSGKARQPSTSQLEDTPELSTASCAHILPRPANLEYAAAGTRGSRSRSASREPPSVTNRAAASDSKQPDSAQEQPVQTCDTTDVIQTKNESKSEDDCDIVEVDEEVAGDWDSWGADDNDHNSPDSDQDFDENDLVTPQTDWPLGSDAALVLNTDTPQKALNTKTDGTKEKMGENPLDRLTDVDDEHGWLGSGWGSLLSAATGSISSTLKHTVGDGISDVIETVQTGLGVPTPEDLARMSLEEKLELARKADEVKESWPDTDKDDCESATDEIMSNSGSDTPAGGVGVQDECSSSGYQSDSHSAAMAATLTRASASASPALSGLFSGVRSTGKSLMTGSLDVLESIGKRTYDVLTVTDEDEGGRRRFILSQQRTNLSQMLRERKECGEREAKMKELEAESRLSNYAYQFEAYEGIAQLEGLEMVSANCVRQLEESPSLQDAVLERQRNIRHEFQAAIEVADSLSEETDQNFDRLLKVCLAELKIPYNATKLLQTQQSRREWIDACISEQENGLIYRAAIQSLADLTARSVETQHKLAQLLLISTVSCAPSAFVRLVDLLCTEIGIITNRFSQALNTAAEDSENPDAVSPLLTALFLEANNSCNYIRESLRLLQPVVEFAVSQ